MTKKPQSSAEAQYGEIIVFQTYDGGTKIQVRIEDDSVWLTQKMMAELYQISVKTVNEHLKHIFMDRELLESSVIRRNRITATDGKNYETNLYRLEAVLAVGYRVRSQRGTQFRQWATTQLEEFLRKGFVMDDERLKSGKTIGDDYFGELLARIRDIRNSERRFYQKVTDIYATSIDYDSASPITQAFYAIVQNKLHWAIHGQTAAEMIVSRADASKKNMGLTFWKNSPQGPIRKSDVSIAKNYLSSEELTALNRIVTMYLDYAEDQAANRKPMHMVDWVKKLDGFLQFNEKNILRNAGKISQPMAIEHSEKELEKYERMLRIVEATEPLSDFDRLVVEKVKVIGSPDHKHLVQSDKPTKRRSKKDKD